MKSPAISRRRFQLSPHAHWLLLGMAALLPLLDLLLPRALGLCVSMRPIFILAIMGIALNILIGYTGLLHLGMAAFMAIGVYAYAIATCAIYPFHLGFWAGCLVSIGVTSAAGFLLGLPTIRLRGDYLALVTLGFGEIVQDVLRNLEPITKGQQGINPLPGPSLFGYELGSDHPLSSYYLFLGVLILVVGLVRNLERSRIGRRWVAIREDELAASSLGIEPIRVKLSAFAIGAALCGLSGALWASFLGSTGDPGNYDFQLSVTVLCMVVVGGMGSMAGVLLGALLMMGLNSIVIVKLSHWLASTNGTGATNVLLVPDNWKFGIFGLALLLTMRFRPAGLLPSREVQAELSHGTAPH